ncbi:MAG: hypothetical protein JJ959_06050 [Nisaea sp.]|uniref:hypothetical protein n=1 Tax=Nisaea sp. TaxID=2024842 RepID=UPI001B082D7C|nr:hypothetical protein [Nisaea sp.]MBO6560078.1 hypothetical protein [Nisaea sp.]
MSGENGSGTPGTGREERKPFILEKPLWRGVFNGVVLCILMLGAQAQGWLGPSTEVTGEDVYRAVVYGLVFGAVMYVYSLWRQKRQEKAQAAASETRDDG